MAAMLVSGEASDHLGAFLHHLEFPRLVLLSPEDLVCFCRMFPSVVKVSPLFSCLDRSGQQLLPFPTSDPHRIRRILVSAFLPLPAESPSDAAEGGSSHWADPEVRPTSSYINKNTSCLIS